MAKNHQFSVGVKWREIWGILKKLSGNTGFVTPCRISSCGDFAPKWRFWRPSGARLLGAIRHLKSGDFGKNVEKPKKVAFSESNLAIFGVQTDSTFPPNFVSKIGQFWFGNT